MDSFSQLTDDLLIKILSFIPTKDAVAMSILSKRWLFLWTLVPRLNFEDRWVDVEETDEVSCQMLPSHFVSGALLLHKSPVLETFHLIRATKCSASEIYLWVKIAVDRFLRDLRIGFLDEHYLIRLPSRLFRSETLETLELQRVIFLEVPSQFSLRSLRTLRLLSVKYADGESFIRLISSSPVLENLVVESCTDDNVETFNINVPSLRSLTVSNPIQGSRPCYHLFVIHSHSLNQLDIVDEFGEVNVIGKMSKLVEASLNTLDSQGNALESLTFVKHLSLRLSTVAQGSHHPIGSIFFQLVRLEFYGCDENWPDLLLHLLQHSPVLKILKLVVLYDALSSINWKPEEEEEEKVYWIQPSCVPECLLFHLKSIEWIEYDGTEKQKEVGTYILENARRLVTATVFPESLRVDKRRVFEELESATRGSRTCELKMG